MSTPRPRAERETYHHGNLPAALVQAAVELLEAGGVEALTLRAAARRAGVSPAAPYRHYEDKDALLAAVATDGFVQLSTKLEAAFDRHKDVPLNACAAIGAAYIRFALAHRARFRVMFGPEVAEHSPYPDLRAASDRSFGVVVRCVEACQAALVVRGGSPRDLALLAWSTVHGLASLVIGDQIRNVANSEEDVEELVMRVKDSIYLGLRP